VIKSLPYIFSLSHKKTSVHSLKQHKNGFSEKLCQELGIIEDLILTESEGDTQNLMQCNFDKHFLDCTIPMPLILPRGESVRSNLPTITKIINYMPKVIVPSTTGPEIVPLFAENIVGSITTYHPEKACPEKIKLKIFVNSNVKLFLVDTSDKILLEKEIKADTREFLDIPDKFYKEEKLRIILEIEDQWDKEIKEDVESGKLDSYIEEALSDFKEGKCTQL
jgi:hypothetical protein